MSHCHKSGIKIYVAIILLEIFIYVGRTFKPTHIVGITNHSKSQYFVSDCLGLAQRVSLTLVERERVSE